MTDPVISIRGLGLSYERDGARNDVLRGFDLEVLRGEFLAIVGSSGVGKSTLLRVLMGLSKPSHGTVAIRPVGGAENVAALVFQDARLLPWRRVLANVAFGLERLKLAGAERRERALRTLARVGLRDHADRWPHQLSGGQRQRVALARALCVEPDLLLMDEPFSALDAPTREGLQDQLVGIWRDRTVTVLFVTHDIDEAVYMADRVIAIGGRPGEVRSSVAIDIERPRRRGDPRLKALAETIMGSLSADAASRDDWVIRLSVVRLFGTVGVNEGRLWRTWGDVTRRAGCAASGDAEGFAA